MKQSIIKYFFTVLFIAAVSTSFTLAQNTDSMEMNHKNMQGMQMTYDSTHTVKMDSAKNDKNSIVREGVIDLKSIDENKDGKVYQDMMDYNVISDKPGKCPLCGMTLKKVTLKKAEETLLKSGFKVKE